VRAHLAAHTTRPRQATLPTLLVAVHAREAGVTEVPLNRPLIQAILAEQPHRVEGTHILDMFQPDEDTTTYGRVRYDHAGKPVQARLAAHTTHHGIVADLPNTECARCTTTNGNTPWPSAPGPSSLGATAAPTGRPTAASAPPTASGSPTPNPGSPHCTSPRNPYHLEVTLDPAHVRGGDGGGADHGADTWFHAWLPHASAYHDPAQGRHNQQRAGQRRMWIRPAIEIN
jgi:hypothetical protein